MKEGLKLLGAFVLIFTCLAGLILCVYLLVTADYSHVTTERAIFGLLGGLCVCLIIINHDLKKKLEKEKELNDRLIDNQ